MLLQHGLAGKLAGDYLGLTILPGAKLDAPQRAPQGCAPGARRNSEDGPLDRLPAERAARDGGPGLSSAAGCKARKARIKRMAVTGHRHARARQTAFDHLLDVIRLHHALIIRPLRAISRDIPLRDRKQVVESGLPSARGKPLWAICLSSSV